MALHLVCDIIQGHGGNAKDRAERDPKNKAQHLAVMNTWLRLYHEVRALVDSPPFLRFERALNHNYDYEVAMQGLDSFTSLIGCDIEVSGENFLNSLAAIYEAANCDDEVAEHDAGLQASDQMDVMPFEATFDLDGVPCRIAAKTPDTLRAMERLLGLDDQSCER